MRDTWEEALRAFYISLFEGLPVGSPADPDPAWPSDFRMVDAVVDALEEGECS